MFGLKAGPLEGVKTFGVLRLGPPRGQKVFGLKESVWSSGWAPRGVKQLLVLRLGPSHEAGFPRKGPGTPFHELKCVNYLFKLFRFGEF